MFSLYISATAQLSIGPHISPINIPAASFKSMGGGITSELLGRYTISLEYFSDKRPVDSVGFLPDGGGNTVYTQYQVQYKFIHLSASFLVHLVGGISSDKKFSLYLGGGLAGVLRTQKINYMNTDPPETQKDNKIIGGFEFLAGLDYNLGFAKIFLKGKETIFLSHLVPPGDDTALPLLSNTQVGVLIPLHND